MRLTQKTQWMAVGLALAAVMAFGVACSKDSKRKNSSGSSETVTPTESPLPTVSPSDTDPDTGNDGDLNAAAMTQEQCNGKGLAWIPAPAPAKCGGTLASYDCCKEQIDARFPTLKKELANSYETYKDYTLYNCEKSAANKTVLHWKIEGDDGSIKYGWTQIDAYETSVDHPPACPTESDK